MSLQLTTLNESFITIGEITGVRSIAGVCAFVCLQRFLARENPAANIATNWRARLSSFHDKITNHFGFRTTSRRGNFRICRRLFAKSIQIVRTQRRKAWKCEFVWRGIRWRPQAHGLGETSIAAKTYHFHILLIGSGDNQFLLWALVGRRFFTDGRTCTGLLRQWFRHF